MSYCYHCQYEFQHQETISRRDECPQCHKDMRACYNCRFFDEQSSRQCTESQADLISDKEKANFCGWFKIGNHEIQSTDFSKTHAHLAALFSTSFVNTVEETETVNLENQLKDFMKSR
ncbi:MAG: hypothetical protein AB8C84_04975 [Oligoflexales bacterium]